MSESPRDDQEAWALVQAYAFGVFVGALLVGLAWFLVAT